MTVEPLTPRKGSRAALADELLALLFQLRNRVQASMPPAIRDELQEVTSHQMEAVGCLINTDGLTMHELAQKQGCAMSTATSLADRLIKAGLADRVPDPTDRRVVRLVPTERARELKGRFHQAKREAALTILSGLDVPEIETLTQLLRKIATAEEVAHG
ncbi:MAG: MarR family winged helix-turn-helix transcriptional regulator [Candidatus Dormibacteria bacterium]